MIAWWMAQIALLGTLLAVAAFGTEAALIAARKPTRLAWIAALVMTVVLGALAPSRLGTARFAARAWVPTATVSTIQSIPASETAFSFVRMAWRNASELIATGIQRGWGAWHDTMPSDIGSWLLMAWALTSAVLLTLFVGVHIRYHRRRMHWPLGSVHGTTVRIAKNAGPAVIGVTNAEIVLPHWLLTRGNREQELVLAHEMEHVRAHDPVLLALAQVAVVLLPWHPAVWWMASRLRLAIELDCDRRVLQRGASTRDYGTLLIDLTDHRSGFGVALPAFSCRPSHLERRLVAMTPKRLRYPLIRVLAAGAMASLAVLAACEAKLPTSGDVDNMTASSATAAAGKVALIDTANVVYYVDNVQVSKAEAEKIAAERIATVNVVQKGMQSGGEVRITTILAAAGYVKDSRDSGPTRINYKRLDADAASDLMGPTRVTLVTPGDAVSASAGTGPLRHMSVDTARGATGPTAKQAAEMKPRTAFTGIVIIDGVISDMNAMSRIAPDQIATVNVIKGATATSQYSDPRAANGVIVVHTKGAKQ